MSLECNVQYLKSRGSTLNTAIGDNCSIFINAISGFKKHYNPRPNNRPEITTSIIASRNRIFLSLSLFKHLIVRSNFFTVHHDLCLLSLYHSCLSVSCSKPWKFVCVNRFTSLCKNLLNSPEFLAEAFRCHVHHFQWLCFV